MTISSGLPVSKLLDLQLCTSFHSDAELGHVTYFGQWDKSKLYTYEGLKKFSPASAMRTS